MRNWFKKSQSAQKTLVMNLRRRAQREGLLTPNNVHLHHVSLHKLQSDVASQIHNLFDTPSIRQPIKHSKDYRQIYFPGEDVSNYDMDEMDAHEVYIKVLEDAELYGFND